MTWGARMKIVYEKVEGIGYMDVLISPSDILDLQDHEMVEGCIYINGKPMYIGLRVDREAVERDQKFEKEVKRLEQKYDWGDYL